MVDTYRVIIVADGKEVESVEVQAADALGALGKRMYNMFQRLQGVKDLKVEVTKKGTP